MACVPLCLTQQNSGGKIEQNHPAIRSVVDEMRSMLAQHACHTHCKLVAGDSHAFPFEYLCPKHFSTPILQLHMSTPAICVQHMHCPVCAAPVTHCLAGFCTLGTCGPHRDMHRVVCTALQPEFMQLRIQGQPQFLSK